MQIINFYQKNKNKRASKHASAQRLVYIMMIKSMLEIDHYSPNQIFITSKKKKNPKGTKEKKYMKIIFILQLLEPQSLHIIWIMLMGVPRAIVNKLL